MPAAGCVRIDALLTDVVMPGVAGSRLIEQVQRLHPGLPAVLMFSDTGSWLAGQDLSRGRTPLLRRR